MLFNFKVDKELLNSLIKIVIMMPMIFHKKNIFWSLDVTEYRRQRVLSFIVNYKDEKRNHNDFKKSNQS